MSMITAVLKSGEKSGMSIYRGITVEPRFAQLFAMIVRLALAEEHGVRARGQAGC